MWDAIGQALKVFFEKHLIPTVISIVSAIVLLLVLPSNYWMIAKIGKTLFLVLATGICFLLVKLIISIFGGIQNARYRTQNEARYQENMEKEAQEHLEEWLSFVDKLPPQDRDLIIQFINSGNKPIIQRGYRCYSHNSIYETNAIITMENHDGSKTIKLDERFFNTMKAIYEQRGSISHF